MALKGTWVTDTVRVLSFTAESSLLLLQAEGGVTSLWLNVLYCASNSLVPIPLHRSRNERIQFITLGQ
jgi:hypothetical protein